MTMMMVTRKSMFIGVLRHDAYMRVYNDICCCFNQNAQICSAEIASRDDVTDAIPSSNRDIDLDSIVPSFSKSRFCIAHLSVFSVGLTLYYPKPLESRTSYSETSFSSPCNRDGE